MNNLSLFSRVRMSCAFAGFVFSVATSFGDSPVLRWNGASGDAWDTSTANWLDAGDNAVAWQAGATAQFDGNGGIVNVAADTLVSNMTFSTNGYTLLGAARLTVEGAISTAAATTNSIAADLLTVGGLAKTGTGALALARCTGALSVQEGSLLVSGSLFADADISVASGASVVTLGDPDTISNLILNPGFESPTISAWGYIANGTVVSNWVATALPKHVGLQNAAKDSTWNAIGSAPEGNQMLILQYDGAIAQTVTVPADGLYSIAFSHILRNSNLENMVYVSLDGIPLAAFLNRCVQFYPGRFASGALWLKAGSHTLGIAGEGLWGDRSSMIDAVCFAQPSAANACRSLTGDSVLKVVTGATVSLQHSGAITNVYVAIDGTAASGTFTSSHASGIFSGSGSLVCSAPANVYTWSGTGNWSETARWAGGVAPVAGGDQNLLLRFPSADGAAANNDLSGTFLCRRLWAAGLSADGAASLAGNAVMLTNTSPKLTLSAPGSWTITAPISARSGLTVDTLGDVIIQDNPLGVTSNGTFYKSGPGTLSFPAFTSLAANAVVYEGMVQTPQIPSSLGVSLYSQTGKSAAFRLTQGGLTFGSTISLMGSGTGTLGVDCGNGTVTLSNWTYGYGSNAVFDVAEDSTLSLRQMLMVSTSRADTFLPQTQLLKAGAGTLEIRSAGLDTSNSRAYQGNTILRNGTLRLLEDDWGTLTGYNSFNGRTYAGTGGSLGYNAFSNQVVIGDDGTAASDNLALIASGDGRYVGHNIEVFNKGATVTLGMTAGTVMFAGTVTLHRDITLSGPTDGVMVFSNIVAAADFSGTGAPTFSGLAGLVIEGGLSAAASLVMDGRELSFGTYTVKAQTLNALVLGSVETPGTLNVDFDVGANDTIATTLTDGLTLSNTVVNLYYANTGLAFAEPGTYTLFTYAGTLGGDVALLSVGNPQSGASYAFTNDTANSRVTLTIGNTSGGSSYTWKNTVGGDWATGANWDIGAAPNAASVLPLFGLAVTEPATIALGGDYTVGGLSFNNGTYGYTLSGGSLTFDNGVSTPSISVFSGTHTLDTTLNGSSGLAVSTASGNSLILSTNAVVNTDLALAQGTLELRGNATLNASAALGASSLLRINATNATVGTLSGATNACISLTGSATKLTVNQSSDATFAGLLRGDSGSLSKNGAATLTLDAPATVYSGRTDIAAGTLALRATPLAGAVGVASSAALSVQSSATNGLMGFYYSVSPNTNNFWTLAGMEAHFATLKPDFAFPSGLAGTNFDFTTSGTLFPQPYGSGGSRTTYFEAVYRGVITVPESGSYIFGLQGDDGFVLAIDGKTVVTRNGYISGWTDGFIRLDAGRYDIVIGYFQLTGGYGLQLHVKPPSASAAYLVPNAWLAPYSSVGTLTGNGTVTLAASNAVLCATQNGVAPVDFLGTLSGAAGALLAKAGSGTLTLDQGGANAFAGDVDVQAGMLALNANDSFSDTSFVRVRTSATFALASAETIGGLAGDGALAVGGYAYAAPFTDDSDSGVSSSKTYTHTLDFPSGTADAVVNGVTFYSSAMSGSRSGYGWSVTAGTAPTGAMNQSPYDYSYSGVTALLWDFIYGSYDYTLTLTGLTPNKAYEMRFYFRNWASNQRTLVFTFSTDAGVVGIVNHNPDSVTRSIVGCRYTAGSDGTVSVRVLSTHTSDSCHLYALSNEEIANTGAPALTLAPAAGKTARFTGGVSGYGTLAKTGAGTQTFGGANTLSEPLDVQQGTVTLEAGASITAGVAIASGAVVEAPYGSATLGGLSGAGTLSLGAYPTNSGPYFVNYTNDAGTGVSVSKTYTHLLDFGGSSALKAVVNGVAFEKTILATGTNSFTGYAWIGAPSGVNAGGSSNIGVPSNQGIYNLLYDMNLGMATGTLYLTGLTVGKHYEVRLYHRCWVAGTDRTTRLVFDPDGPGPLSDAITFNPDAVAKNDNYLGYRYVASSNALAITIQSQRKDLYHLYGLSNEESYDTQGNPVTLNIANSTTFAGTITGQGALAKTGSGALTVTGVSTATGPVSVNAGAFGVADGGTATLGPVTVASGATLFGNGLIGGAVSVASNAWIMAGTAAQCGTLQTGGSLTLAQGTCLAWRFDTAANDTFIVNGVLSFPTNGVVQASALTANVQAPSKAVLFSSSLAINGPTDLTGWSVTGVTGKPYLTYSDDRTQIYFKCPHGTLLMLQ